VGVLLAVVVTLLLAGCTGTPTRSADPSRSPSSAAPAATGDPGPAPAGLETFYGQQLHWKPCRERFQCARLEVPLDYAHPDGRSIEVALLKVPASGQGHRLGSLVFDPGGPGVSGVDYVTSAAAAFGKPLLRHYDIIGIDPRGVGASTPVDCLPDDRLDEVLAGDPDPDTPAEISTSDRLLKGLGQGCLQRSGALARHISTVEVAKDLDVLRGALREPRLTYFGASYGTAIGSTYADLFPKKVGRMVLDGALDPTSSTLELNRVQAKGFETALRAYVQSCIDKGGCFLGSSVEQGTERVKRFLDDVERKPLPAGSGRELDVGNASYGIAYPLYDKSGWPVLSTALQRAFAGDGTVLMLLADAYLHRTANDTYKDNSFEAFYAVNCLDHDDAVKSSQLKRYYPMFDKASPTFGRTFLYSATACQDWPVHTGRGPQRVHAAGSAPIMVVGTTRDPATPLEWARSLARQLDDAVLVTRDGDGHTGYHQGSRCVDDAVESYLVDGTVPKQDVRCS
jgi:pimeloyl-ACP methyl ester carboxylesterase